MRAIFLINLPVFGLMILSFMWMDYLESREKSLDLRICDDLRQLIQVGRLIEFRLSLPKQRCECPVGRNEVSTRPSCL